MFYLPQAQPAHPVPFHASMSGRDQSWWRTLLVIPVFGVIYVFFNILLVGGFALYLGGDEFLSFLNDLQEKPNLQDPVHLVFMMASLAVFIPAAMLTTLLIFRTRMGFASSVYGRIRWSWLGISTFISLCFSGPYIIGATFLEGVQLSDFNPNPKLALMLALIIVLVPLQSAGEEYAFRGVMTHFIGALVKNPKISFGLAFVLTSLAFGLAHSSLDPAILIQLSGFGAAAWYLTYRTGGLEAAIGMHAMNNTTIFALEMFIGESDSLVGPETTTSWASTLVALSVAALETAAILWVFKKWSGDNPKRSRLTNPAYRPQPTVDYLREKYQSGKFYPEYFGFYPPQVQLEMAQRSPELQQFLAPELAAQLVPQQVPQQVPQA